jgi:hypothetical protein
LSVFIERILANPLGSDIERDGGEFVQLRNPTEDTVDVSGWTVRDDRNHVITLPAGSVIEPYGALRLHPGPGLSSSTDLFDGRGAAIINNTRDILSLLDPQGTEMYALSSLAPPLSFGFVPEPDLEAGTMRLLFDGDDPLGFGVEGLFSTAVELLLNGAPIALQGERIVDKSTIEAALPAGLRAGWYDVTLRVTDGLTQTTRTATEYLVEFGNVDKAVVALRPAAQDSWRFGDTLELELVEPVGKVLSAMGITANRLQPRLLRADGGVFGDPTVKAVGDRSITFQLPGRYSSYEPEFPLHRIDPGLPLGGLSLDHFPLFELLPIKLLSGQVADVLANLLQVQPTTGHVEAGTEAVWSIVGRARHELPRPGGMSGPVFEEIQRLLYDMPARIDLQPSLELSADTDETGCSGPWVRSNQLPVLDNLSPASVNRTVSALIRPRVVTYHDGDPAQGASRVNLKVKITATLDPSMITGGTVVQEVRTTVPLLQLPLMVPRVAVATDQRFEHDGDLPMGRTLVLVDGISAQVTTGAAAATVLTPLRTALQLVVTALPKLATLGVSVGQADVAAAGALLKLLGGAGEITVVSRSSVTNLSSLGQGIPNWEDVASAIFLLGLPGGRTLRLFSERTIKPAESAYLDLRMPAGHIAAGVWTLHESVFQPGFGARAPFRVVTEPSPEWQKNQAEADPARVNMPWYPLLGKHSFGNVASAFAWV